MTNTNHDSDLEFLNSMSLVHANKSILENFTTLFKLL